MQNITIGEIITIGGVIVSLVVLYEKLLKPVVHRVNKLEKMDETLTELVHNVRKIDGLKEDIKTIQNKVTTLEKNSSDRKKAVIVLGKTQHAILGHIKTGNHTGEMAKCEKELEEMFFEQL